MEKVTASDLRVRRSIRRFLRARPGLEGLINDLQKIAPVAVFGGMVRDASAFGLRRFRSDVDLVVESSHDIRVLPIIERYHIKKNRFGGYRFVVDGCPVDLWPLGTTWALRKGLVAGTDLSVLPRTTFFTCDAVAFDLSRNELHYAPLYRNWVVEKLIEINMRSNPNEIGVAIRALRFAAKIPDVQLGPELVTFLYDVLKRRSPTFLCEQETCSYSSRVLAPRRLVRFAQELDMHMKRADELIFRSNALLFEHKQIEIRYPDCYQRKPLF